MVISSVPLNMGLTKIGASKSVSKFKILLLQTNRNRIDRTKVQIYIYLNLINRDPSDHIIDAND